MDIHATNTVIQPVDPNGVRIQQREIPTQADKLIHWARNYPHGPLQVILEQGTHARWVASAGAPWVKGLIICGSPANALVHAGGTKNDRTDAHKLARGLRLGEYKPVWWQPIEERHVFKSAMKMYLRQRTAKTAAIQRLTHYLRHIGVRIPVGQSRFSFKRAGQWLEQVVSEGHRRLAQQKLAFIRYHHEQSISIFGEVRRQGIGYWEVAEFAKIPGIGPIGSHLFSAFLEDPHRFATRSQVYKFCQLGVIARSSGGQSIGRKRLDKRGYGELKAIPYRAWMWAAHTKADNEIKRFWQASCRRASSERNARGNTQRKIINVMWSLPKNGRAYDPAKF
jgi:transposase